MIGGFANSAFANTSASSLDVQFTPDPLFNKPNFLPLDETSGIVTVKNNSDTTQTIITEANHVLDNDHFGNFLNLKINGDNGILFDNTLAYFFTNAGEYSLGTITSGETKTFTYTVSFIDSSDNSYQGKTLGFEVCVGFQGGNATNCGNTAIGNENGGGGGGSTGSLMLIVFNEEANNITNVNNSGSAVITWNTNKLATSQVIYGLTSGGPYTLNLNAPNFGYPFSNIEDSIKVMNHSMFIDNLIPGQSYSYRVVSKASPATVSFEHNFVVPLLLAQANNNFYDTKKEEGSVLGESTENPIEGSQLSLENVLSASILNRIWSDCYIFSLLIFILIYLIWKLWLRKKYKKSGITEETIENRFYLFFAISSAVIILILLILGKYCPLSIFVIVFILSTCFYSFRKLRSKK
jgi:hypothetical protein